MKKLILAAITLYTVTASATVDYKCMSECMGAGYSYGYCARQCEY